MVTPSRTASQASHAFFRLASDEDIEGEGGAEEVEGRGEEVLELPACVEHGWTASAYSKFKQNKDNVKAVTPVLPELNLPDQNVGMEGFLSHPARQLQISALWKNKNFACCY